MRGAASYMVPRHLAVTPDVAPMLAALLVAGRDNARRNHLLAADDPIHTWLRELDAIVRPADTPLDSCTPAARWISTAQAAIVLGIGERAVRLHKNGIRTRKVGNRRL